MDGFGKNSPHGYSVLMSHCSPKDADGGSLRPVFTIKDTFLKLVPFRRTVRALLKLYDEYQRADNIPYSQLFFFPYQADLDRLSEWRCYINENRVVVISQSKLYQCNHAGITDDALRSLAMQVRRLWAEMAPQLRFDSCVLDIYAEVKNPDFTINLIEINPRGAHAGSGSLLFHWLDDVAILSPKGMEPEPAVVIRLVEEGESPVLSRDEAYRIGRERITEDELRCLRERGMEWISGDDAHAKFMTLPLPAAYSRLTTRKHELEMFQRKRAGDVRIGDGKRSTARDHPRFVKLKRALHV